MVHFRFAKNKDLLYIVSNSLHFNAWSELINKLQIIMIQKTKSFCAKFAMKFFHLFNLMSNSITIFVHKIWIDIHSWTTHMCKLRQPKSWNSGSIYMQYYVKADIVIKRHKFYLIINFIQFTYTIRQSKNVIIHERTYMRAVEKCGGSYSCDE